MEGEQEEDHVQFGAAQLADHQTREGLSTNEVSSDTVG